MVLAVALVLFLPALPFGTYLIYPFVILTTWFHEMGHGLTALLLGQDFEQLMIFADGSGVAQNSYDANLSPFARAAISAGGPLAPVIAGSGLIVASAHPRLWRPVLWGFAAAIFISVIIYVRSSVGYGVLPLVGAALALIAWKASAGVTRFILQFIGVLGAMSMLSDVNYLFTEEVLMGGRQMLSDTGNIEAQLFLPHWFWAGAILLVSTIIVGASLKYALSEERRIRRPPIKRPANVLQFKKKP